MASAAPSVTIYSYDIPPSQSIEEQKEAAVANPEAFENEIVRAQIIAKRTIQDPRDKTVLCDNAVKGYVCFRRRCDFAHRLTTYYAVNLLRRTDFKLKHCSDRGKKCTYGDRCSWVHPGDLAQRWDYEKEKRKGWYIAPKAKAAEEKESLPPVVINVQTMNINITTAAAQTPPPPYQSPEPSHFHTGIFTPELLGHPVRPVVRPQLGEYVLPPQKLRPSALQQKAEESRNDPLGILAHLQLD